MRKALSVNFIDAEKEFPRCITPWLPHVDYVIAIDGRFKTPLPPTLKCLEWSDYSTDNSYEVLKKLCGDKLVYEKFTGTQMQKRQRCLDIAGELKCDFSITFDSDDYLLDEWQDWQWFDKQLENVLKSSEDFVCYMWCWIPDETLWPKQHNHVKEGWQNYMRIHKDPGNQKYAINHWTWAFKDSPITEHEIYMYVLLHGINPAPPHFIRPGINIDGVRFTTDRTLRTKDHLEYGDGWPYQEDCWDKLRPYNHWRSEQDQEVIRTFDIRNPDDFYFDEKGVLIWYNKDGTAPAPNTNGQPRYLQREETTFASFL